MPFTQSQLFSFSRGRAKSLFADQSQYEGKPHKSIGPLPADPTPLPRSPEAKKPYKPIGPLPHDPTPVPGPGQETIQEESESIDDYYVDVAPKRKPPQIFTIIKGLLKRDYQVYMYENSANWQLYRFLLDV